MADTNREAVLRMIAEGKIAPEDGTKLLQALNEAEGREQSAAAVPARAGGKGKFLRVICKMTDAEGKTVDGADRMDVDVNVPIKFARRLAPVLASSMPENAKEKLAQGGYDIESIVSLLEMLDEDMEGRDLVNVSIGSNMMDNDKFQSGAEMKVRVYVE